MLLFIFCALACADDIVPGAISCTDAQEAGWESYLRANPQDVERAACLLDYYAQRLPWANLYQRRLALIRWVIENHPGIRLSSHLSNDLHISTQDKKPYSEFRSLWLKEVSRFPNDPQVLSNAGDCLSLTDRKLAASWLARARILSPGDENIAERLADLYAAAIVGIAATGPDLLPSSLDLAKTQGFAKSAWREANRDATLAALTGLRLHYWTNFLRYKKLSATDYDGLAEKLLLRAADLEYPQPTRIDALRSFYRDESAKRSGRIEPKARIVELASEEAVRRLVDPPDHVVSASPEGGGVPVVRCRIVVGVDGHVWQVGAESSPLRGDTVEARVVAESLNFKPLRYGAESVQFKTSIAIDVHAGATARSR
jgi:hypothetical protein